MEAKTYNSILQDATKRFDDTIQQVDSNGNLTYYFYVVVEYGEVIKYQKTYVIGQGEFKQPRRTKFYKTMQRMLDTWDNRVVSCGYALEPPLGCAYTRPSHEFIADLTTT
jgi:hypothetical protein